MRAGREPAGSGTNRRMEDAVSRFLLGFLVAIVIVIFIVVQCAQALL